MKDATRNTNGHETQEWTLTIRSADPGNMVGVIKHENFTNQAGEYSEKSARRTADSDVNWLMDIVARENGGNAQSTRWVKVNGVNYEKSMRVRGMFRNLYFIATLYAHTNESPVFGGYYPGDHDPETGKSFSVEISER